jgi:hypothetical protein
MDRITIHFRPKILTLPRHYLYTQAVVPKTYTDWSGIVSSVADKFEYRLFAASVTRFFETYLDSVNRPGAERFATSPDDNKNDLIYVLKPFVRVLDKDIGASQKAMDD